MFWCSAEM